MRAWCVAGALAAPILAGCASLPTESAPDAAETRRAHALFAERWEEGLRLYPEFATHRGDDRYNDRLSDASSEGIAARNAWWRSLQQRASSIDRERLFASDRVSLDILRRQADDEVLLQQFDGYRAMSVTGSPSGFQRSFADLLRGMPVTTTRQVEQLLARIAAYPRRVDQEIARLRAGMASGWVPPRATLERAVAEMDAQLRDPILQGPFFEPFRRLPSAISATEQAELRQRGERAIAEHVLPAMRRLRDFVAGEYLAAAPVEGGLGRYPGGDRVYAALIRTRTTTTLSADAIHRVGLDQVTRLRGEMEALIRSTGFTGDFAAFIRFLEADPRFFYDSGDALLAGYRDIAKRIDAELPRLFAELPRAPYGVRALPSFTGIGAAANYDAPSIDGRRPGWFNANVLAYKTTAKWSMESLVAHETVPGHHLQSARALEIGSLPEFRRTAFFTVYSEGWALYAETLGSELGLYADPYSRFGALQKQLFRAVRLVVDTGIHAFGWERQRAIDYLAERTGLELDFVTAEVDRYISWPAQALAYMIGQLKISELRDRAQRALGERFDVRKFHMVVLDTGPVPLDTLERAVDDWIASLGGTTSRTAQSARP